MRFAAAREKTDAVMGKAFIVTGKTIREVAKEKHMLDPSRIDSLLDQMIEGK